LADGSAAGLLRRVPAIPGRTILIPAGTVHALGAGVTVYEIQQPSNVTFRLDDWGRVDASGAARELHHEHGLAVANPESRPEPIPPIPLPDGDIHRELLAATRYFALERISAVSAPLPSGRESGGSVHLDTVESPQVLTVLAGVADLESAGWVTSLAVGETAIVPVGCSVTVAVADDGWLLRGWVPDLGRDIIAPARAAGATDEDIDRLGVTGGETGC
jgi:mannose-6-phosphate isomerase